MQKVTADPNDGYSKKRVTALIGRKALNREGHVEADQSDLKRMWQVELSTSCGSCFGGFSQTHLVSGTSL